MFHLNDRTLERLVTGSASLIEVDRIRRHVAECRACARRLEEWRDTFPEVDQHFPMLAQEMEHSATVTPGGLVLVPFNESPRSRFLDVANLLWGLAVVLALVVGYGLSQLRPAAAEPDSGGFSSGAFQAPLAPLPSRAAAPNPVGARETTPDAPEPVAGPESLPSASRITDTGAPPEPARDRPEATAPPPAPAPLPISPRFARIARVEAARRLGGSVRGVAGLEPEHYEVGPASAVPGAQRNLDVVRVVYRVGAGGRLTLDQQAIPVDSTGFRPIDDPALESGETVYRSGPNGVNTAVWLDEAGYRLALSARISQDSLRRLVPRVQ